MANEVLCNECNKKITDGKIYQDRYFFNYHCSWECLVKYMCEFFDVTNEPEITVINGITYYDEDLDQDGKPIEF